MAKRRLLVAYDIDAADVGCLECRWLRGYWWWPWCKLFRAWLSDGDWWDTDPLRCQPCLDAEKAGRDGEA